MQSATIGGILVSLKFVTFKSMPTKRGKESRMEVTQMATKDKIVAHNFGVFLFVPVE
jgi:hypothetical protein